jgi:myosin heavy subunit
MNFTNNEVQALWRIIATVLHLGNLDLNEKTFDGQNNFPCQFFNEEIFNKIVELLAIDKEKIRESLLFKFRKINQTIYKTPLQKHDCISLR